MLDYEWTNTSTLMIPNEEAVANQQENQQQTRHDILQHYDQTSFNDDNNNNNNNHLFLHNTTNENTNFPHFQQQHHPHHVGPSMFDPRAYAGTSSYAPPPHMMTLDPISAAGFLIPKSEEVSGRPHVDFTAARIGLNLGGRTYFSSTEDDFVNRLYRRTRVGEPGSVNLPRCQAEGCNAELTHAKHYHRRHKVCEYHSKAATAVVAGLTQRFCQQCSRFHLLSEFDNGKRSCRKRLADHNRRRRKSHQANQESHKNQLEAGRTSSPDKITRSPPDSGVQSSSVTIAVSPPRISLDCYRQRPYEGATASSTSSSSVFFSSTG